MSLHTTTGPAEPMEPGSLEAKVPPAKRRKAEQNVYRMENRPRGKCVIINNFKFHCLDHWRHGSDVDASRMEALFNELHFDCVTHHDLSAKEMKAVLEEAANPEHHKDADCLVVVLMSHGMWDCIFGVDAMALHLHRDVYALFSNENCPTLLGKPKVFIVQACRGPYEDSGTLGLGDQADAIPALLSTPQPSSVLHASGCSDMYIIYASSRGYKAYRNADSGSFFLKTLCKVFRKHACAEHLEDLMSRVHGIVKKYCANPREGCRKQTPSIELIGWEKKLYFNPGLELPCSDKADCLPLPQKCATQ